MKQLRPFLLLFILALLGSVPVAAQAAWQVTRFEINADTSAPERGLSAKASLTLKNVGRDSGTSVTLRISPKAQVTAARVGEATLNVRSTPEPRGGLQRISLTLPSGVASGGVLSVVVDYRLPIESNSGLAAVSPLGSQFLPLSWWYPQPNTQFMLRGADVAPFRLTITAPSGNQIVSSGKGSGGVVEQSLNGMPFFLTGTWDLMEGSGDAKGISAYLSKGASPEERKQAEQLIAFSQTARSFYTSILGPAPDSAIKLVAASRGAGFNDAGTVLLDPAVFRRGQLDAGTATLVAESVAKVWLGAGTAVRGEGSGAVREGLSRYLATMVIEKQFGKDAADAERNRERSAYSVVARRDAPLAITTPLDDTYFTTVTNKGALVWRLVDRAMGHEAFLAVLKAQLQSATGSENGFTLGAFRSALGERGGAQLKNLLDASFDRPTDMDLLVGLPQQKGGQWAAALRNTGTFEVKVSVAAVSESGQRQVVDVTLPAQSFGEAVFTTTSRIARVEVDPDKLYQQIDYSNDVAPRSASPQDALAEAAGAFARQDFAKAESALRNVLAAMPQSQDAHVMLGRTLSGLTRLDDAEREFNIALKDPLPSAATLAWSNVGLGEIALRRGQAAEALRRFTTAASVDAEYGATLAARLGRIKAEALANAAPPVDASAQSFIQQLDQAIKSGHKNELDSMIVPGELTTFVKGIVGSQPELWQTRVLRTEQIDATRLAADVSISARELGKDQAGTAVLMLSRVGSGWKLNSIEFFEVR